MQVDAKFEKFLKGLPQPLELNSIRTLKPEKYAEMRKLLSNFTGSPVLKLIKDNQEALDLDPDVFDLVYEGFWDLYTLQPKAKDVGSKKKLQDEWIKKINLTAAADKNPSAAEPAEKEDKGSQESGGEEAKEEVKAEQYDPDVQVEEEEDVITAPDAVVRIKIPKSLPD